MNRSIRIFCLFFLVGLSFVASAQTITSVSGGGPWNQTSTWQGGVIPTNANSTTVSIIGPVTIPNGYSATAVGVTIGAGLSRLTIDVGGSLSFSGVLNQAGAFPPTASLLTVNGTLIVEQGGTITPGTNPGKIVINGVYRHNYTTSAGTIYNATWNTGSTLEFTGYTTNASPPGGLSQTFYNVLWNCPSQIGGFVSLDGSAFNNINGDFTIQSTNFNGISFTTDSDMTMSVGGDLIINDFIGLSLGTGNATINLSGGLTLGLADAMGNYGSGSATINFVGSGAQSITNTSVMSTAIDYEVFNGSTISLTGNNFLSSAGTLDVQSGATVEVGSASGLVVGTSSGNIRTSGTRTYNANANIVYNSTSAQNLGNEWGGSGALNSAQVNLEIDNSSSGGVTNNIIGTTSLVGDLILTQGSLNIGNSNTLDIGNDFIVTGGTIGGSATSNLVFSGSGSLGVLSMTSGAAQLNNLTVNRAGDLVLGSDLTVGGVLDLTGNLDFSHTSARSLTLNGSMTGTGGLKSNNNCTLTIGGTGAFGTVNFAGSGNQLSALVLNKTSSGTYTWSSAVTITNAVSHNFGTLTHSSGLTMAAGSTYFKGSGSITGLSPIAVSSYNVEYVVAGNTGLELPSSSTALNDLRINTGGTVALQNDVTINGDLILDNGIFNAGSNDVTMAGSGASVLANGGSYSQSSSNAAIFSGSVTLGGTSIDGATLGNVEITGSLNMPNVNVNISGYFDNSGTFTANNGTVTFTGASSSILGATTTFHNLGISAAGVLTASSGTTNVSGSFINSGTFSANGGTIVMTTSGVNDVIISSSPFNNLTINAPGEINLGSAVDVNGTLTLSAGILDVTNNNRVINLAGNWTNNGGTFNERSGTVIFDGTNSTIAGSASTNFHNLQIANGTVRVNGTATLENTLTLSSSTTFDADGTGAGSFTLLSDISGDARIAAIPGGATVTGNLTFERYLPAYGDKRWRNIGSAVSNATVADLQNEIMISGNFTGNNNLALGLPATIAPPLFQSMARYDESLGLGLDNDWVDFPAASNTETLSAGSGYSIYVRDVGAVTFDLRGTLNQGNISLPVSGTGDLWNLVSNPYPSSIDWDNGSGWTRSNIQGDAIAVWNGLQYLTWNGSSGSLGNGRIPMGMAFWVQAANSSVSLNINENAKTSTQGTVQRELSPEVIELSLTGINYVYTDKTHILFNEESNNTLDIHDLGKLPNAIFNLSTQSSDGHELSINSISNFVCGEEIPINITNLWVDSYRMEWSGLSAIDEDVQIFIKDNVEGIVYDMRSEDSFVINITTESERYANVGTEESPVYTYQIKDRFSLVVQEREFSSNLQVNAEQVCDTEKSALITILNSEDGVLYELYSGNTVVADGIGTDADLVIPVTGANLENGDNSFKIVASRGSCNYIEFDNPVIVNIISKPDISFDPNNSTISTNAIGNLQWYENDVAIEGQTGSSLQVDNLFSGENVYKVKVYNNGCEKFSEEYLITGLEEDLLNAGIEVYPNPVSNKFYINLEKSAISDVLLRILSSSGKVIYQQNRFSGIMEIDASSFESGLYMVEITDEKSRYVTRIVKQ